MKRIVLLYMPVVHKGYVDFLKKYSDDQTVCYLLGADALRLLDDSVAYVLKKDYAIRALDEYAVRDIVASFNFFASTKVIDSQNLPCADEVICPDEDVNRCAAEFFFPDAKHIFDGSLRLRYDRKGAARVDPIPEGVLVTSQEVHRHFIGKASEEALKSYDWWLQVGAAAVKDGELLFVAFNKAMPDATTHLTLGDPRSIYSRGENTDDTLVLHSERDIVSQAAYHGVSLKGADAYVTHFPCVPCASGLARAGIARLYFKEGYSRLESLSVLQRYNVEVIRVV